MNVFVFNIHSTCLLSVIVIIYIVCVKLLQSSYQPPWPLNVLYTYVALLDFASAVVTISQWQDNWMSECLLLSEIK